MFIKLRIGAGIIRNVLPTYRNLFTEVTLTKLNTPLIPIRNRKFLPGSDSLNLPEYIPNEEHGNLKIVKWKSRSILNKEDNNILARNVRTILDENIDRFPAMLIKGLPITSVKDFNHFTEAVGYKKMTYASGSAFREEFRGNIYAASDEQMDYTIEPHNEMSYLENSPSMIMFCCIEAAEIGGESPIVFNRNLLQNIDKTIVEEITKRKVRYYRNLPHENDSNYITWQSTFECKTEEGAEKEMKLQNINWKWNNDGSLSMWNNVDAMRQHPVTGENVWFNQVTANHCSYYRYHPDYVTRNNMEPHKYHFHCSYGDGEEFEEEVVDHVRATAWNNAIAVKLEKGDILCMDNFLCQHGRMGYSGNRKLVVQLIE